MSREEVAATVCQALEDAGIEVLRRCSEAERALEKFRAFRERLEARKRSG